MGDQPRDIKNQDSLKCENIARTEHKNLIVLKLLAACTVIISVAGHQTPASAVDQAISNSASGDANLKTTNEIQYARSLSRAFREVAKRVGPSVVAITTIDRAPFSSEFGQNNPKKSPNAPRMRQRMNPGNQQYGKGTGIIYSSDGLIITNNHVIAGGDEFIVRLSDGREMKATQVGSDHETDLAIIRVQATDLHPATFGDSTAIEIGDWVLAIGCPFGLEHSVTAGIISAKGRDGVGLSTFEEYIQTDAAINPGNSGGPLIDLDGNVVGINSGIASQTGGSAGIGFAIPSHIVKRIADSISKGDSVRRGWLGVSMQELNEELAENFGLDSTDGVLISGIVPRTPAANAGLAVGDIIMTIDGKATQTPAQLMRCITNCEPNTPITLGFIRSGKSMTTDAMLGERPSSSNAKSSPKPVSPNIEESLGLEIRALDSESAIALGATGKGVYISATLEGGAAENAGITSGDVIREVNGMAIIDVETCRAALAKSKAGQNIRVLLERDGKAVFTLLRRNP
ncbi:MAG: trypsin-like peptidase domain-containing protein [Planctomycetota bacterium]|nr:trypsin-like peptidase domain-containing protein [Planctomycetota bacterium]